MLEKYTSELKKISMGILTYNSHRIKASKLENKIDQLVSNPENIIYLWRGSDNNYDGLVVLEKYDEECIVVKSITLRNNLKNTVGYNQVLNELKEKIPDKQIMGVEKLKDVFGSWKKI
ncbi:hypothetical protein [Xylocopilactobacillus apicola]|uniref:Reductase n=1 Tax=Xylocopilactobacillus apicola TaxID=2932184 RepID=A0AAU9DCX9_9LACO|nr:hypothetical protein [Xylocopilactobacillus apicola]BDR58667.1 hypothetical protein XA3_11080 [Xylocopilactobacillus apicola]